MDSIANTRHNLSLSYSSQRTWMNVARNDYNRVCVYCHTPHGSNSTMLNAPLWNRTNQVAMGTTYTLYNTTTEGVGLSSEQIVTEPGINSLTCLSCHDGTVAIDSIINMPGSGGYFPELEIQNISDVPAASTFWTGNPDGSVTTTHMVLGPGSSGCTFCHTPGNPFGAPDFAAFVIGTDLRDDHPIGIVMPDAVVYGFNEPAGGGVLGVDKMKFFDLAPSNGHADRDEIRLYDTGDGYEVECASCHDPHGVVAGGGGTGELIPSFLRVNNDSSGVCLTCHVK